MIVLDELGHMPDGSAHPCKEENRGGGINGRGFARWEEIDRGTELRKGHGVEPGHSREMTFTGSRTLILIKRPRPSLQLLTKASAEGRKRRNEGAWVKKAVAPRGIYRIENKFVRRRPNLPWPKLLCIVYAVYSSTRATPDEASLKSLS